MKRGRDDRRAGGSANIGFAADGEEKEGSLDQIADEKHESDVDHHPEDAHDEQPELFVNRMQVHLQANRGAFVASPTPQQAREVFEARLTLEPTIARLAVERATDEDIKNLTAHLVNEHAAHHEHSRHEAIRLSGQFHLLLAQIAANSVMLRMMKELVTRTSLIIGIFGAPSVANCRDDDHERILHAFKARDGQAAADLMAEHLRVIEGGLELGTKRGGAVDLVDLFARKGQA